MLVAHTSRYSWPLPGPGLDLWKPPSEVTGFKHVHGQRGDALQNYSILALALPLQMLVLGLGRRGAIALRWRATFSQKASSVSHILSGHDSTRRLLCTTVFHIKSTQREFKIISLFSFSSSFYPHCVSGFSCLFTSASLNAEREWAHCFVVTGKQLYWDSQISPWESLSQSSTLDPNLSSWCTFGEKLWRIFLFLSSPVHCFAPSLGPLKHRSVSPLSGGEQGRDSVGATQLDWVVWEVWVVLLSSLSLTLPSLSLWGFSN